ncbi:D-isomer specific 2-hydroxyacid dehydrogenase [Synechococcus sp. RS9909]|uniref:2-hydroxyacid dehydrogenase n=1 Tax=unclassified Synechococcus TaxID=2626047 RepID=UPI000068F566|nr:MULTISPECIES: 2-hydroxyacid dehydrogenase [unclassified Synechococcus]EAQ69512.1 D-lactate dehydrogenase [Synechococcus sp. RS9917]QNI80220.1 D-isomer specific 2-hydroxyacid dehydrogenase [Synechococcus sp. RS9909]
MKVWMASARHYDIESFVRALGRGSDHLFVYSRERLSPETAVLADGSDAVCSFVNDDLGAATLEQLAAAGVRLIALRCAGADSVDLEAARRLGLRVVNVPAYAPESVAEYALALLLCLCRRLHRAHNRVRENNFDLSGLVGVQLHGKTAGVVGTGLIGSATALLFRAFGMTVLASDPVSQDPQLTAVGIRYVALEELLACSQVVSLHCPLLSATHHMINAERLALMPRGALLVNTSRGALLDTPAVITALKRGQLGGLALDVYEQEGGLFFADRSADVVTDDTFERLLTFPNVLVSAHQAFLTDAALEAIATTTLRNLDQVAAGGGCDNDLLR